MKDVECPYCGEEQDIDHDDGAGWTEDRTETQACTSCNLTFVYTTSISYHYEAEKAPCQNGGEHAFKPVVHVPKTYPDWVRCSVCDYDKRGLTVSQKADIALTRIHMIVWLQVQHKHKQDVGTIKHKDLPDFIETLKDAGEVEAYQIFCRLKTCGFPS